MLHLRHSPRRRGATAVETAVVLGLLFLVLLGIMEYGRYVMFRHVLENAAREGARYAVVHTNDANTSAVVGVVQSKLTSQVPSPSISVFWLNPATGGSAGNWFDTPYGEPIMVHVQSSYAPMLPTMGILPSSLTIDAYHVMRSEAN
jgi:hypothetical protein